MNKQKLSEALQAHYKANNKFFGEAGLCCGLDAIRPQKLNEFYTWELAEEANSLFNYIRQVMRIKSCSSYLPQALGYHHITQQEKECIRIAFFNAWLEDKEVGYIFSKEFKNSLGIQLKQIKQFQADVIAAMQNKEGENKSL